MKTQAKPAADASPQVCQPFNKVATGPDLYLLRMRTQEADSRGRRGRSGFCILTDKICERFGRLGLREAVVGLQVSSAKHRRGYER